MARGMIRDSNEELAKWGVEVTNIILTDLRPHDIMLVGEMLEKLNKTGFNLKLINDETKKETVCQ